MTYTADKRYYANRELTELVPEDNPDGAVLLVAEGGLLTDEDAARWGLTGTPPQDDDARPSPEVASGHAQVLPVSTVFPSSDTGAGTDTAGKAIRRSQNKAIGSPDATKGGQDVAPDVQMLPKNDVAPGS